MKRLLMLLSAAAVVASGASAYADPASKDDTDFLKELSDAGLTYKDPDTVIAVAKDVCDLVNKGTSANDIVQNLQARNPGFSGENATKFTLLAANSYCPRYVVGDPQPSKPPGS